MKEVWKPIKGYEEKYLISNLGRVKSIRRNIIMKTYKIYNGYHCIAFRPHGAKGGQQHLLISRLVASHFLPMVDGKGYVNHKDGNKDNNSVDNLEWVNREENERHKIYVLKKGWGSSLIPPKKTKCVETGEVFLSRTDAARKYGVRQNAISLVINDSNRTMAGYHWVDV